MASINITLALSFTLNPAVSLGRLVFLCFSFLYCVYSLIFNRFSTVFTEPCSAYLATRVSVNKSLSLDIENEADPVQRLFCQLNLAFDGLLVFYGAPATVYCDSVTLISAFIIIIIIIITIIAVCGCTSSST